MSNMDSMENIVAKVVNLASQEKSGLSAKDYAYVKEARQVAMDGVEKLASITASGPGMVQSPYPTPFLNLSDTHIPRSTLEIFRWCKYFYTFDPLIAGAVNALANFPITEIYLEDTENFEDKNEAKGKTDVTGKSDSVKLYERLFFKEMNIYKLLVEIGIDYYLYGNCFVFGQFTSPDKPGDIEWKSIRRLDPSMIIIDYNPVTCEKTYKWRVPAKIVEIVRKRSPIKEYNKIPAQIREAVLKKGAIVLNPENIYHFARPTDSMGDNSVWGTPIIANVMKLLMYRNILRQAQEAIAREHIVPFRVYYLQSTETINLSADWGNAAESFAGELMKSVKDPNHKVVSPVPVGLLNVGGDGRALLMTAEIEQIQTEILAGMNVPREFIFGGVSYSGSSVSLKILENQFITYRLLMEDFIQNFCIKKLAIARKEWVSEEDDENLITVRFNDLKMQDDVQQKQLIINLNSTGKVSDTYMLKMLALEPDKIQSQLEAEAKAKLKMEFELKKLQNFYDFELQKQQMVYQARLQRYEMLINRIFGIPNQNIQLDANGNPIPPQEEVIEVPNEDFGNGVFNLGESPVNQTQDTDTNDIEEVRRIITELNKMPEEQQQYYMSKLPEETQRKLMLVKNSMNGQNNAGTTDMRPMPEQRPPRRDSLK